MSTDHHAAKDAPSDLQVQDEGVDSLGSPKSCGKPLCSPGDHHPLCNMSDPHAELKRKGVTPQYLAPCPFCGQQLFARWHRANPSAKCVTPDCYGGKMPCLLLDVQEYIDAWNTRMGVNVSLNEAPAAPRESVNTDHAIKPDGFLNWWPAPGGGHDVIWSASDGAAKLIGCHHEAVYRPSTLALMGIQLQSAQDTAAPSRSV